MFNFNSELLKEEEYSLLFDVFEQSSNNKISIGEDWKNVVANSSCGLYYTDFVDFSPVYDAESFFENFYSLHLNFLDFKELKGLPPLFINDLKDKDEKFTKTIEYLLKRLPENCNEEERRRAKETLSQFLVCLTNLDDYHKAQFDSLFSWLVREGRFAEIYSFRKLVEADLNIIPNLKIKTKDKDYEIDALIPTTTDTVIRCECTLSKNLDKDKIENIDEVKKILKKTGLCKTLVIGRECLRSSIPSNVAGLRILSFSELNKTSKVISTILSLI